MRKFLLVIGGVLAVVLITVGVLYLLNPQQTKEELENFGLSSSDFAKFESDFVGTHTVTTTAGVGFYGALAASTTYISQIGGNITNALLTFKVTSASTTALANFELFGSNDYYCQTTATSGGNLPLKSEINWFSVGDHFQNRSHLSNALNDSATSFFTWSAPSSTLPGAEILLTNLNYECLRLDVAASSTVIYVGMRTK